MTATLTLDEAGRILLPKAALRKLGVKPGVELQVEVTRCGIALLEPAFDDVALVTEFTPDGLPIIPAGVEPTTDSDIVAAIKAGRDERERRILGR